MRLAVHTDPGARSDPGSGLQDASQAQWHDGRGSSIPLNTHLADRDADELPRAEAALHLLLARSRLTDDEQVRARNLADAVPDWSRFARISAHSFGSPFVLRHQAVLQLARRDGRAHAQMHAQARRFALDSLRFAAAQRSFHDACIGPVGAGHVYLKGPCLAAAYHGDIGLRPCRDIDVLVSEEAFEPVLRTAMDAGYAPILDQRTGTTIRDARDLRALLRYKPKETPLRSPDGVIVELHRSVDDRPDLFDTNETIAASVETRICSTVYRVLPAPLLLVYLCQHHTRHLWSKLHWVADLDAVLRHPDCDLAEARAIAERKGLGPVLEACLGFHRLTGNPDLWHSISPDDRAAQLLEACIDNLGGDLDREREIQRETRSRFRWAGPESSWTRTLGSYGPRRLRPALQHYVDWPLPDHLQWLYSFVRIKDAVGLRLARAAASFTGQRRDHWK